MTAWSWKRWPQWHNSWLDSFTRGIMSAEYASWEYSSPCSIFFFILLVNFLSIWYQKCFFSLPVIFLQRMWVYDIVINIFFWGGSYFIHNRVISCASFHGCVMNFTSILSFWSSVITPEQTICERKVKVGSRSSKKQFKQFFKVAFSLGSISGSSIEADYFKFLLNKLYGQKSWNLLEYILNI